MTGGAENMSLAPHAVRGIRFGVKLGMDVVVSASQKSHLFRIMILICKKNLIHLVKLVNIIGFFTFSRIFVNLLFNVYS